MPEPSLDRYLDQVRRQLDLSSETEHELLAEIRAHLEDAAAEARGRGLDEEAALGRAAEAFGLEEAGRQLQQLHQPWESADAILACAVPVLCALVLRWLIFAPDGTALGWPQVLARPALWIVAAVALLVPLLQLRRWRYALAGWCIFWAITLIFAARPPALTW